MPLVVECWTVTGAVVGRVSSVLTTATMGAGPPFSATELAAATNETRAEQRAALGVGHQLLEVGEGHVVEVETAATRHAVRAVGDLQLDQAGGERRRPG